MTPDDAIFGALTGNAAVATLVSDRVFRSVADEDTALPYIVFLQVSAVPDQTHEGASGAVGRLYQVECYADTPEGVVALRIAAIAALDGIKMGNGETPTLEDERDANFDDQSNSFRSDADFYV